jgi:hypothetical protein
VIERSEAAQAQELAARLEELQGAVLAGEWPVAPLPDRELCAGCPGRGTLCTHALADTLRAPTAQPPAAATDDGDGGGAGGELTLF